MASNACARKCRFHTQIFKIKSPYRGRGQPTPSPRPVASLPRFAPPFVEKGLGYASECILLNRIMISVHTEFAARYREPV